MCFNHRISITRACPLYFHKGHAHVDVIWIHADVIRVLEHIYAKKSKLLMRTRTDFEARKEPIREPQGACTIILKAEWENTKTGCIFRFCVFQLFPYDSNASRMKPKAYNYQDLCFATVIWGKIRYFENEWV